jgi:hypothetical protein
MVEILYTATQIAACLEGKTPQAVRKQLRDMAPTGERITQGNQRAAAWSWAALPVELRRRLDGAARARGCGDGAALLERPASGWQPKDEHGQVLTLRDIAEEDCQYAVKLQRALSPSLVLQDDPAVLRAELEAKGVADYARELGHAITPRYFRELLHRVLWRDGGVGNWNRLEIFLPAHPKRRREPAHLVSECLPAEFARIGDCIDCCGDPHKPTENEEHAIWTLVMEECDRVRGEGLSEAQAGRRLRDFLFAKAPFLAPSREALKKTFARRLKKYLAKGRDAKALGDGRAGNTGNHDAYELPESDRDLIIYRAVWNHGGRIAAAWRELLQGGELSSETLARYYGTSTRISHVPELVIDGVGAEVECLSILHRGPRAFDSAKGHVQRSYEGIASLQCFQADDFTLPVYWHVPDGQGWFNLVRGQCLIFIDFRSSCILGWSLQPERNYSSLVIRSLCTHVFEKFGVPQVLYFERGIWQRSSLLKGKTEGPNSFVEISQGLREFNIRFLHAIRPRSKTIERIGETIQRLMEGDSGYCGRDERKDAPESLRKQMAEVEGRRTHPSKYFYDFNQWNERLAKIFDQYNATAQQGRICDGKSPAETLEANRDFANPPMNFEAGIRFLLACHKEERWVTFNGVTLQYGKQIFNYRGQEIAHLVGRMVLAWFDPENPETLVVTDMKRKNPICVARSQSPNALEALVEPESGTLARELERVGQQASYMKTRYNTIKLKFGLPCRQTVVDSQTRELAGQFNRAKAATQAQDRARRQQVADKQQFERETGVPLTGSYSTADLNALRALLGDNSSPPTRIEGEEKP